MRAESSGTLYNRIYIILVSEFTGVGCPLETDGLWQIIWPNTPPNITRIQRCPEERNWIGNRVSVYLLYVQGLCLSRGCILFGRVLLYIMSEKYNS